MLGVRRFRECQIDLWVGDQKDFHVDRFFSSCADLLKENFSSLHHIHIAAMGENNFEFWLKLRKKLESSEKFPRRITVIFSDVKTSEVHQEKMFEIFNH